MNLRRTWGALAVLLLSLSAGPALSADNYPVKDGNGATVTIRSKDTGSGIQAPANAVTNAAGTIIDPATSTKQPALGTAGAPSGDVLTVQGSGSGTPIPVTAAATVADAADVAQGALADAACATDNGTCSVNAVLKRIAQRNTTLITAVGSPLQAGGTVTANLGTIAGVSTAVLQGAQGTGATYNPPTGGSGEIGYLSGIYAAAIDTTPVSVYKAPTNSSSAAITPVVNSSAAAASNRVLCSAACNVYRVAVVSGASAGYLLVINATSAPADGALASAALMCAPVAANTRVDKEFAIPLRASTGVTLVFSTGADCFTKTASATAAFEGSIAQ